MMALESTIINSLTYPLPKGEDVLEVCLLPDMAVTQDDILERGQPL